jgi:membrane associated rhomboid family serine protease
MTYAIIAANIVVFLHELQLSRFGTLDPFLFHYGMVPKKFIAAPLAHLFSVLSSMFLHGGWAHIIGNMWFLYIFGDNVEDAMGPMRFLFFYLTMGLCAAIAQTYANPHSAMPMIGASGAIAGVLGAYVALYPGARVLTFFVLIIFVRFIEVPAFLFLGLWFVIQAMNGFGSLTVASHEQVGGIAWWAHASGFVAGFIGVWIFRKRR